jgi:NADH-quinone oxidoreductase subunit N
MRVFFIGLDPSQMIWTQAIAVLAALAMIVGNATAIVQTNIKRMLAYSSVAQIGYILVGAVAVNAYGATAMTYYMLAYLFANMGAFMCVIAFSNRTGSEEIADYSGLARRSPAIATFMTLFLLSLAGIPPTAGFLAKYYVFLAAIDSGYLWLVLVGLLTSVVALFYYANVIRKMFFPLDQEEGGFPLAPTLAIALSISALGVLYLGIFPSRFVEMAKAAAAALLPGL